MAANYESGVTYGERAWHKQDNNLAADDERRFSVDQTLEAGSLEWTVAKKELAIAPDNGELSGTPAEGVFGIFRTDTWQCLAGVGRDYHALQNRQLFEVFQPFADARQMAFESAGSLDGGKRIFVQASLCRDAESVTNGDKVKAMLLLASSHDGSLATSALWTPQRVVCANTLAMAFGNVNGSVMRVKHTKSQEDRLAYVQGTIDIANQQFSQSMTSYRKLASQKLDNQYLKTYVQQVLGIKAGEKVSTRTENQFDRICYLATRGKGNTGDLTCWTAYNGVTEFTSHFRQSNPEARQKSVWFGASKQTNQRALDLALQLAS